MQHFFYGLKPKSTHFMNVASEGSDMYRTVVEVRTLLEKVLNSSEYTGIYDDPPEPLEQPSETQQLRILSATSSPPPPYIEEITEPRKSPDHEPLIEDMWIDDQIVESKGVLHAMSLQMGRNKIFLDFHVFDVPEGEEFVLIGQPIEPLVNPNGD